MEEVLPEMSTARVLSKVDRQSGYWHCELDHESSLLSTIITPLGRYRWNRLPWMNVSADIFQRKLNQTLEGLEGVVCVADDIVVFGHDEEDHDKKLRLLLQRCCETGMKMNRNNCEFNSSCDQWWFETGRKEDRGNPQDGKPDRGQWNSEVAGNSRIPFEVPTWQFSRAMEPTRRLTQSDVPRKWTKEQDEAMTQVKKLTTESPVHAYNDPQSELVVESEAGERGLGAAVLQNGKPIAHASRALTSTETRYAQIEKERLATVFALERFHQYTFGRRTIVHSDHKPLEMIVKKPLH